MNNKTDIKEDIKILEDYLEQQDRKFVTEYRLQFLQAIENILADRERLIKNEEIQKDNYQMLSESVSSIAKELELQEDAIIDEIITKIKILKSKRINMFERLDCIDKANKYDSLVNKTKEVRDKMEEDYCYDIAKALKDLNNILDKIEY